jgi:hypothetical protein
LGRGGREARISREEESKGEGRNEGGKEGRGKKGGGRRGKDGSKEEGKEPESEDKLCDQKKNIWFKKTKFITFIFRQRKLRL